MASFEVSQSTTHQPRQELLWCLLMVEDQAYSISANDLLAGYTADGDQNNLSIKSISSGASITASGDGEWNLIPAKDYSGEITVSFIIDDGNQGFALGETTVNLQAVNDRQFDWPAASTTSPSLKTTDNQPWPCRSDRPRWRQ